MTQMGSLQLFLSKSYAFNGKNSPKSAILTVFVIVLWLLDIRHSVGCY